MMNCKNCSKPELNSLQEVLLASPRGFCSGVRRAVDMVEAALQQFGTPIYVYHEIIHNRHVVDDLRGRGVVFVENIADIPDSIRPLIISAHGASRQVFQQAAEKGVQIIDATCPLVKKVHRHIQKLEAEGAKIFVAGIPSHAEIKGTVGQLKAPESAVVISSEAEAAAVSLGPEDYAGAVTQTTLNADEAAAIIAALRQKCPKLCSQDKVDICYASTNRQKAVKKLSETCEGVIIIGSKHSSNSRHLQEVAQNAGVTHTWLIDDVSELNFHDLSGITRLGISAGASAPERLVQELVTALKEHYNNLKIREVIIAIETNLSNTNLGESV